MAFFEFRPRDPHEDGRTATTLELMFDLASVIAVSAAALGLHHGIAEGHALDVLPAFVVAFFMIWWSWMNYTWFASAYDNSSTWFRVLSMVAMFGALSIAAGIPAVFAGEPLRLSLVGFVIMRAAMAAFWFGAAAGDPDHRKTALGYAFGIVAMQVFWVGMMVSLAPGTHAYGILFVLGVVGELAVPAVSEGRWGVTNWHRHHIIERYGLLNIIVLGECFVSIASMIVLDDRGTPAPAPLVALGIAGATITFGLWGVYFTNEDHLVDDDLRRALPWGYGHFVIFAAGAAVGAGFAVYHEVETGVAGIGYRAACLAIAMPAALYCITLWVVRDRHLALGARGVVLPLAAAILLALPFLVDNGLPALAIAMVVAAILRNRNVGLRGA